MARKELPDDRKGSSNKVLGAPVTLAERYFPEVAMFVLFQRLIRPWVLFWIASASGNDPQRSLGVGQVNGCFTVCRCRLRQVS